MSPFTAVAIDRNALPLVGAWPRLKLRWVRIDVGRMGEWLCGLVAEGEEEQKTKENRISVL